MKKLIALTLLIAAGVATGEGSSLLDYDFRRLASEESINLAKEFDGRVVLVVNTASKCGNTPQYDGLEGLYEEYGERGFTVVGIPSNDFMGQEPGTEEEIQEFCRLTYKVKFPMTEKTVVKEGNAHPMYDGLATAAGTYPTWNFHKYLIGRDGELIAEFSPRTQPYDEKLVAAIEAALDAS
jgi:glutathione peroxidase